LIDVHLAFGSVDEAGAARDKERGRGAQDVAKSRPGAARAGDQARDKRD